MQKVAEKTHHLIHLKESALIEKPMILIPIEEYQELIEDAEAAKSKKLAKEIETARKRFIKGKGKTLGEIISELEDSKTR